MLSPVDLHRAARSVGPAVWPRQTVGVIPQTSATLVLTRGWERVRSGLPVRYSHQETKPPPSSFTELVLRPAGRRLSRARRQQSGVFP